MIDYIAFRDARNFATRSYECAIRLDPQAQTIEELRTLKQMVMDTISCFQLIEQGLSLD